MKWFAPAAIGASGVIFAASRQEAKWLQADGSSSQSAWMSASAGNSRRTSSMCGRGLLIDGIEALAQGCTPDDLLC
ncbi:MAG: hypothetical protein ACRYGA_08145 [Janthinobacterium lividum]